MFWNLTDDVEVFSDLLTVYIILNLSYTFVFATFFKRSFYNLFLSLNKILYNNRVQRGDNNSFYFLQER